MAEWNGIYFYGDYCTGVVWGLLRVGDTWQNQALFSGTGNITSFGQDERGEVYLVDDSGKVLKFSSP
jgi:hypothetical protein